MDVLDELQSKYNVLATEYSKLRSQIPVLKKAFTEEQSKNNSLSEEIKLKDQQLRIAESEADSLNFRNQQLLCRVTVLQEELESLQISCKKDVKSKNFEGPQFLHNFDEELSKKVAENATLIFTLNEYKERHELEVKALKDEIAAIKSHNNPFADDFPKKPEEGNAKIGASSNRNMIGETIQKALEKQLFETQQLLQETIVDRDRLKQKLKFHEDNLKNGFMDYSGDCEPDSTDLSNYSSLIDENHDTIISSETTGSESPFGGETAAREQAIKRCYKTKYDRLINEKIMFKSKAETFEEESQNLKSRLENEVIERKSLEEQLEKERLNSMNAKEELTTTTENYEIQLSTMSDHLAGLNDVIEEQKGQLYTLQSELQKHSSCKIKK